MRGDATLLRALLSKMLTEGEAELVREDDGRVRVGVVASWSWITEDEADCVADLLETQR